MARFDVVTLKLFLVEHRSIVCRKILTGWLVSRSFRRDCSGMEEVRG